MNRRKRRGSYRGTSGTQAASPRSRICPHSPAALVALPRRPRQTWPPHGSYVSSGGARSCALVVSMSSSCVLSPHSSRVTHHASLITRHSSRVTHHASLITRHSSRVTHHALWSSRYPGRIRRPGLRGAGAGSRYSRIHRGHLAARAGVIHSAAQSRRGDDRSAESHP